ncbi:hypothetical protein AB0E96_27625 [Kitasatospora sp. NPDC036755]|uniref:hypothetical protein n=1 Tax=Kitasatospora sp. NPDC036755 TaxID=3154600 RepID=UPI00340177D8
MATEESGTLGRDGCLDVPSSSASVFDLDARLPGQAFTKLTGDSLFCEFDAVLTREFWPALRAMARWHGDDRVELLVLEPGPDDLHLPERRFQPTRSLSVDADEDDYWEEIGFTSDDDFAESIAVSAKVIAVTGPSGRWGCWGERDPEVTVFRGFPDADTRNDWRERFGPFLEVSAALDSYLSLAFTGHAVPDAYAAALTANYGPPNSGRP